MGQTTDTLRFSSNGGLLFHGEYKSVRVWHNHQFVEECPGRLVGIAHDGQTFLNYDKVSKSFSAWQSNTGTQIAVSTLNPEDYAVNQRYLINGEHFQYGLSLSPITRPASCHTATILTYERIPRTRHDWFDLSFHVMQAVQIRS